MQQQTSRLALLLSVPALVALAACGGGGSSSTPPPAGPDVDYTATTLTLARGIQMDVLGPVINSGTPDAWAVTAGTLPAGLLLDAASGVITGVPSASQAAAVVTVTATETGVGSDTVDLTFTVDVPAARALYVLSEGDGLLATQRIDPADGFVNNDDLITGLDSPRDLCLTPDLEYLYVVNFANGTINGYDVDPLTAELTELATSPETMIGGVTLNPSSVVTSPGGDFLFVADRLAAGVSRFTISASGDLTELGGGPTTGLTTAHDLVSLRRTGGDFLYVLAQGLGSPVVGFSIDAAGDLTQIDTEGTGPSPIAMAATPEGDRLYVLNSGDATISGYDVGTDGTLTEQAGSPYATVAGVTAFPLDLTITSDGTNTHLYTTDNNGDISQSTVGAGGALTLIGAGSVSGAGANYRGLAASPDGGHLYVIDQGLDEVHTWVAAASGALDWHATLGRVRVAGDFLNAKVLPSATTPVWGTDAIYAAVKTGSVAQLTLDGTGAMDPITPLTVATTTDTEFLVVHPDHDMVYVTNPGDATNPVMSIPILGDLSLDGLSLAGSAAVGNQANFLALTPGGDHLLMLAQTGTLSAYPIGATGLLGAQGASVATGTVPLGLAVGPTGKNAYVANFGDNTVSMYDVDLATGAASAKAPATVATGASVRNVVVHPSGRYAYATAMGAGGPGGDLIGQYLVSPVDGTLILNTPTSVGANPDPGPMACTPNGEFLLVGTSASGTASIDVYTINTDPDNLVNDGTISGPVSTAAVPDVAQWISVSADGAEVYVASNTAGTIQAFTLSAAGVLAPLDGETIGATVRGIGVKSAMQ